MKTKIIKKYFWFFNILFTSFLAFISSGFIKNLYFRMEDFGNLYFYFNGGNRSWPHQALNHILYAPHLIFSDQPVGHFILVLILYILFSLSISFYVWEITKNKTASFISAIIFSSGWIGSEMLFMVETGWYSLYYILSLFSIITYYKYLNTQKIFYYLASLSIFIFVLVIMPFRAFSLIALVLLTHIYVIANQTSLKNKVKTITSSTKHLLPFLITHFLAYNYLPRFFNEPEITLGFLTKYNFKYLPNLLSDFGNFIFPSTFQNIIGSKIPESIYPLYLVIFTIASLIIVYLTFRFLKISQNISSKLFYIYLVLYLPSIAVIGYYSFPKIELFTSRSLGIILIFLLAGLIIFIKNNFWFRKTLIYLGICFVASYIVFHIKEYDVVHPSWSKYLISAYPFYIFIIALIITTIIEKKHLGFKLIGWGLLLSLVSVNLIAGLHSPLREKMLTRSEFIKKFDDDIKKFIPSLNKNEKYLFYFDVTTDNKSQNIFNSFFETGIYLHEIILANLFRVKLDNIKLARDYNEFSNELNDPSYSDKFTFYYNKDMQLINTTSDFFSERKFLSKGPLNYLSNITTDETGSKSTNNSLKIDINDLPSVRPIKLMLKIKATPLISNINKFPYRDGSLYGRPPNEFFLTDIHNPNYLESLLKFIKERKELKTKLKISSSGNEYPDRIEDIIDSNDDTAWRANKNIWRAKQPTWIEANFPQNVFLEEIRWISRREGNFPTSYEYQTFSEEKNRWETLYKVKDIPVKPNTYIIDNFPRTKTQKLRMLITETNGDFPAISEIEFLTNSYKIPSEQANFILEHPFAEIKDNLELTKIFSTVSDQLKISVYPISDKSPDKNHSTPITQTLTVDNLERQYSFTLPPGGTKLTQLLIEFPNIPLSVNINTISLVTLEK